MTYPVTGHMIVKNEDRFVWFAIQSVLPYLEKLIIYDTGSTDKTVEIIREIKNLKIDFQTKRQDTPEELVELRREQIKNTTTPFFLLVDGDEIWPDKNIQKLLDFAVAMSKEKLAIFCRTRNCVGDVWHYLPEDAGHYRLGGMKGHFNIRLFRKTPQTRVIGTYPLEAFTYAGKPVNDLTNQLVFVDTWYLHATHLNRSSTVPNRKFKYELGISLPDSELPGVMKDGPAARRSVIFMARALIETPLRWLKRKIA